MGAIVPTEDLPDNEIDGYVQRAASDTGLPAHVIHKVIQHESSGNPNAVSPTGPVGLMQVGKAAAQDMGANPDHMLNPAVNVGTGAAYLKKMVDEFGPELGFAAYHDGPTIVREAARTGDFSKLSAEANKYVEKFKGAINKTVPLEDMPDQHIGMEHARVEPTKPAILDDYRTKDVKDMSFLNQMMVSAGRETSKLLAGLGDAKDMVGLATSLPVDMILKQFGADDSKMRSTQFVKNIAQRELGNRDERKLMQPYEDNVSFLPDFLGRSMPYMLDSIVAGPMVNKGAGALMDAASTVVDSAKSEGRGLVRRGANALYDSSNPILKIIGEKAKNEIVNPMDIARRAKVNALASGAEDIIRDPMWNGVREKILGGTILGGAEGALNKDNTAVEGAMNAAIGGTLGAAVKPMLTRLPDYYRPMEREIMNWAEDKGYKWLPGMETGAGRLQMFEAGMKNSRTLGDVARRSDLFNDQITNSIVSKAMGIKDVKSDLSPGVLRDHLTNLGNEYDNLTKDITVHITPQDKMGVLNHFKALSNDPSEQVKEASKLGKQYYDWIDKLSNPVRDPFTGKMQANKFNGEYYQEVRRSLKATIDDAWTKGDAIKAKTLAPLMTMLDKGTERGALKTGSTATYRQLKDLNERNAMTHLVLEHGFDPLTGADPVKLGAHFLTSDPKRYATQLNSGSRLKTLQNVSKLELLRNRQAGGNLTGMGIQHGQAFGPGKRGNTNQSVMQAFMQTPAAELLSPVLSGYMKLYEMGVPAKTGYLGFVPVPGLYKKGLSGKNFGDTINIGRSLLEHDTIQSKIADKLLSDDQNRLVPVNPFLGLDSTTLKGLIDGKVKVRP